MSVDDFFQVIEKSSLLSAEQLQAARQQLAGESDPKLVARKLLAEGRLTTWQARHLLHGRHALMIGPYKLLEQLTGDNVVKTFLAQHGESGQKVELRTLSRSHAAERPEAVQQFVEAAEKLAGSQNRKLLEVHRPQSPEDTCYVALEETGGSVPAAAAATSSDSAVEVERESAEVTPAAAQPSLEKKAEATHENPAQQETVAPQGVTEMRPPKLKTKARPASPAPAPAASAPATPKGEASPARPPSSAIEIKLPGQDGPAGIVAAPKEFKIATGKRRKKPAAAPTAAPAGKPAKPGAPAKSEGDRAAEGAEPVGDEKATPASKSRRALSPALLIGGAVGGGLLLVAVAVLAWMFFSGGKAPQVADAGGGKKPVEQAKEAPKEGDGKPDESAPPNSPRAKESEPSDPVVDPVVIVETPPPASDGPKPATKPDVVPAEKTAETPQPDSAKTEPAAKTPEAKPAESKDAVKPEAKKPPAPPPNKKPFADLKDFAAIPDASAPDAGEPKVLGPIYIPSGELCFVKLRGGEKASKGAQQFVMKNAQGGLAEREWEISVREGAAGKETAIASLAIDDKSQFVFQWKPEAKAQTLSPYLRNCAFSLSCAGEAKAVTLREPATTEGLAVDFDKPSSKNDWKIDMSPNPEAVRFEITGVQGAKVTVDPAGPLKVEKTTVWIRIEDGGGLFSLKVDASLKRDFQLLATPHIKMSPEAAKPDKFVRRMFQDNLKKAEAQNQQASTFVDGMQKFTKSQAPEGERKKVEERLSLYVMEAKKLETQLQNMKKIDELMKKLEGGMKIQFRVFFDADSTEVNLIKAGG